MPSFVYTCEQCHTEIRHLTSVPMNSAFTDNCPKCKAVRKFSFLRDGNVGEDWYSKILIKNKRRRPGDDLYKTKDDNREDGQQKDMKIPA